MEMEEGQQVFTGLLKSFSPKDGYGFIACPVLFDAFGRDVYVHQDKVPHGACAGCTVEFTLRISTRGQPQAHQVFLVQESADDLIGAAQAVNKDYLTFASDMSHYTIVVHKKKGSRLGIDVDTTHGTAGLLVDAVKGGLVEEWNKNHPLMKVQAGDHIIEVNGVVGDAQAVLAECQSANRLSMRLLRGRLEPSNDDRSCLPSLQVVSWNVLAGAYASLKMYPNVDPAILRAPRRRAQVAAALAHLSADVICLQEVDCSLEELGLCAEYDSCTAQRPQGRCDRCVIAWKRDRLEVGKAGHRAILFDDHPPPAAFECVPAHYETGNVGLAVELRLRSDPGKRCITVATTHLCWEPHKMDVRAWQLHAFFSMVSRFASPRILLCGDLNSQPRTQPHQFLAQGCGLVSAYQDMESDAVTNSNANVNPGGFAAMIDYIWYSPKWFSIRKRLHLPSCDELRAQANVMENDPVPTLLSAGWPSDHLALSVVLELANPVMVMDDWDFD
mmetsp:Transcript_30864/g.78139  ORF Transcript_30864/g.78139 Transcript_30864/m.78139 type:complete len:500 (+) Transcript_30864:150-1649(+)